MAPCIFIFSFIVVIAINVFFLESFEYVRGGGGGGPKKEIKFEF